MIPTFHKMSTFGVDMNIFHTMNDFPGVQDIQEYFSAPGDKDTLKERVITLLSYIIFKLLGQN